MLICMYRARVNLLILHSWSVSINMLLVYVLWNSELLVLRSWSISTLYITRSSVLCLNTSPWILYLFVNGVCGVRHAFLPLIWCIHFYACRLLFYLVRVTLFPSHLYFFIPDYILSFRAAHALKPKDITPRVLRRKQHESPDDIKACKDQLAIADPFVHCNLYL